MSTNYENCKKITMNKYMKKFEKKKLLSRDKKPITNRKQAIAIGLSVSEKECKPKIGKKDIEKKIEKVNKFLSSKGKIPLSNVKDTIFLINYYQKEKQMKKVNYLQQKLLLRVMYGTKVSKNVIRELISLFRSAAT